MIAIALRNRKTTFTSTPNNFAMPFVGPILKSLGVIPTPENTNQTKIFLNNCSNFISNNKIIHIFPEGHLIPFYDGIREFSNGAFKIAYKSNAPILPIVFSYRKRKGIFKLWQFKKPCLTLNIGKAIYFKDDLNKFEQIEYLKNESYIAMKKIYDENNNYNMPSKNTLERMTKFEAQKMLINLTNDIDKLTLSKSKKIKIKMACEGKFKKKQIIKLIYLVLKIKQKD